MHRGARNQLNERSSHDRFLTIPQTNSSPVGHGQGTSQPRTALSGREGFLMNLWRKRMRTTIIFAAAAGFVALLGTSGANAMTSTSPAGVRVATEAMDSTALVHCRSYRHWHRWEHRWTHGCHGAAVGVETDVVVRRGHRVRVHEGTTVRGEIRSGTSTRERTTIRSGTSTSTKSGTSTSSKSGGSTSGSTTGRGQGGEKSSTGGGTSGSSGGSSGQSGGQKQ
jgi:hypothetical protein